MGMCCAHGEETQLFGLLLFLEKSPLGERLWKLGLAVHLNRAETLPDINSVLFLGAASSVGSLSIQIQGYERRHP
jgi:hypothetical protein